MGQNWSDVIRYENITLLGVLHYRIEFSVLVNRFIRNEKPDCICVELPHGLRREIATGVRRFPYHSVILYETAAKENAVLMLEGSDGVQEAVRSALEFDIPLKYVDPLSLRYPLFMDHGPDSYLIDMMGQKTFMEASLPRSSKSLADDDDENHRREMFMAAGIQEARKEYDRVLFVGGFAHLPGILKLLGKKQAFPLMKTGVSAAALAPIHPDSLKKGFTEIPKITEVFEKWRKGPEQDPPENRHELIIQLMRSSAEYFSAQTHQEVPEYVRLTWVKFLRKWLRFKGELLPDLYHLVSTARSAMDEDFAYHVHEFLADYAWSNDPTDPGAVLLDEDNLLFHGHKIILHKKLRTLFPSARKYRMKAVSSTKWKEHQAQLGNPGCR